MCLFACWTVGREEAEATLMARRNHADFMINTLAPDLRESGQKFTAADLARCARTIGGR